MPPAPDAHAQDEIALGCKRIGAVCRRRERRGPRAWATRLGVSPHATATPTETGRDPPPRPGRSSPPRRPHDPPGLPSHHPRGRASVPTPDPAGTRPATGSAPATHRSEARTPRAERRPCDRSDGGCRGRPASRLATAPPAPRPDPALVAEPDRRRATRESLPAQRLSRARPRAPSRRQRCSPTTSGRPWSRPAPSPRRRWPASSPSLPATATDPGATAARPSRSSPSRCRPPAEVHLHIDHLEVRRPPAQPPAQPPPARATREPAGSRPVDHAAYLDRQRRRGGAG